MQVRKTVFISYRRANEAWAMAVYQFLSAHGFDAFIDTHSINSGDWLQIILNQIAARAHFVVILTPSALERCNEPGDMLRREIEHAIGLKRNVVPLMFEGFAFHDMEDYLTDGLALLPDYNGLDVPRGYFGEAMNRLLTRYLNTPLELVIHPTPVEDAPLIQEQQASAAAQPEVTEAQLSAVAYFERAYRRDENDYAGKIADYTEAVHLDSTFAEAFNNRGLIQAQHGRLNDAIADFDAALRLNPRDAFAYSNRAIARRLKGDLEGAMSDYDNAIQLNPQDAITLNNRGIGYFRQGNLPKAIADCTKALDIDPQNHYAYDSLGQIYFSIHDYERALHHFSQANTILSTYPDALAGLAVTQYVLGSIQEAQKCWQQLVAQDERYSNPEWAGLQLGWRPELIAEARRLVAGL